MADKLGHGNKLKCYLCSSQTFERVSGKVRDRNHIPILKCLDCGLVFLGNFSHVNEDFYAESYTIENHNEQDWRAVINECKADDKRRLQILAPIITNRCFLDVGCGAGGLVMMARESCSKISAVEPQSKWRQLLHDSGIECFSTISDVPSRNYHVVSLFHVLEHIAEPVDFLTELFSKCCEGGRIVIEVPNIDDALLSLYKNKAFSEFTYWSPHLFMYSAVTLRRLLNKAGIVDERLVIEQVQRYPLSNHLMWLSQSKPGGHLDWSFLDTVALNEAYSSQLARQGRCDTLIAWISL